MKIHILALCALGFLSRDAWSQDKRPVDENELTFTAKEASIDAILRYVSSMTGWVFVCESPCLGTVEAMSETKIPLSRCLDFINSALRKHGLAILNPYAPALPPKGETLKVVPLEKARNTLAVYIGGDEETIPATDEFRIQVIPLRAANAADVRKELGETLRSLLGEKSDVAVSTYSNSLILTARSDGIRRVARLLQAIDVDATTEARMSVFPLKNADATAAARTLNDFFGKDGATESRSPSSPFATILRFAREAGPRPEGEGRGTSPAAQAATRQVVRITPEPRTNSLLVCATAEKTRIIETLIGHLDVKSPPALAVKIYKLANADPLAMSTVLQAVFRPKSPTSAPTGGSIQVTPGRRNESGSIAADRIAGGQETPGQIPDFEATPDSRTRSVIVRAPHALQGVVGSVIQELDSDTSEDVGLYLYRCKNTDAATMALLLQNLMKNTPGAGSPPNNRVGPNTIPYSGMQPLQGNPPVGSFGGVPRAGSGTAPRFGN